jgi:Flp pilus assembly protein TadD
MPTEARTLARLGRLHLRHGDSAEGERLLREAIGRFPKDSSAYFYLGVHCKNHGDLDEAKALLQESVDLEEWAPALIALGVVHWRLFDTDAARGALRRAIAADPNDSEAWSNLGRTYRDDDLDQAHEMFQRAVDLDPENAFALRELGYVLWRRKEYEAAEASVRGAIALVENDFWSHDYLGIILEETDRNEDAVAEYRRAIDADPGVPLLHCHLGDILMRLGRYAAGETAYLRALTLDVSDFVANLRMGQWRSEQRRYSEARRYLERAAAQRSSDHRVKEALSALPPEEGDES